MFKLIMTFIWLVIYMLVLAILGFMLAELAISFANSLS